MMVEQKDVLVAGYFYFHKNSDVPAATTG